eukprot:gene9035-22737_t
MAAADTRMRGAGRHSGAGRSPSFLCGGCGRATRGAPLLKKKADALLMKFRALLSKLKEAKENSPGVMRKAYFSLAEARYHAGEQGVAFAIDEKAIQQCTCKTKTKISNVAGVVIPEFYLTNTAVDCGGVATQGGERG